MHDLACLLAANGRTCRGEITHPVGEEVGFLAVPEQGELELFLAKDKSTPVNERPIFRRIGAESIHATHAWRAAPCG